MGLKEATLPQALNARHPSEWNLSSCRTAGITPHCFPVLPPAPTGLGPNLLGKGVGGHEIWRKQLELKN